MPRILPSRYAVTLASFVAVLLACDTVSGVLSSDGRIEVTVATEGGGTDFVGYTILLDGTDLRSIDPDGTVRYDAVGEGDHTVTLSGIPDHCALDGINPRTTTVREGDTSAIRFAIICALPEVGGFQVEVSSTGGPPDDDGYQLSVAGAALRVIAIEAIELFADLAPGVHLVTLKDVAPHCKVQGGNPQPFTVVIGKTVRVRLGVHCGEGPGPL